MTASRNETRWTPREIALDEIACQVCELFDAHHLPLDERVFIIARTLAVTLTEYEPSRRGAVVEELNWDLPGYVREIEDTP